MCHKSWSLPTWRLKIAMNVSCPPKKQLLKGDEKLRYFSKFRTPGINLCTHSLPTNGWNGQDSKCFQFWLKHVKVLKHSNLVYKPFKLSVSYDSHVYIYTLASHPGNFRKKKSDADHFPKWSCRMPFLKTRWISWRLGIAKPTENCTPRQNKNHSTDNVQPIYQVTFESLVRIW